MSRNLQISTKALKKQLSDDIRAAAIDNERKIKSDLRKELEEQHIHDVYSTYTPIQQSGMKVKKYNETHSHQVSRPYHDSGLLLRSIKGVIDGDIVKIEVEDNKYKDGTSAKDVYEWLDKGTKNSEYDVYILGGKGSHTPYVEYIPTPKHGFKQITKQNMDNFIQNTLIPNIKNGKYLRKTRKGAK